MQGNVRLHALMVGALGGRVEEIRHPDQLLRVDGLIFPGGESSAMWKLLTEAQLVEPLIACLNDGMPALGTCAGLILMARQVQHAHKGQGSLGTMDVVVDRNAYGPQIVSREEKLEFEGGVVRAAFIRAPKIVSFGHSVIPLIRWNKEVVGVQSGPHIGLACHPEVVGETAFHSRFLEACRASVPVAP